MELSKSVSVALTRSCITVRGKFTQAGLIKVCPRHVHCTYYAVYMYTENVSLTNKELVLVVVVWLMYYITVLLYSLQRAGLYILA